MAVLLLAVGKAVGRMQRESLRVAESGFDLSANSLINGSAWHYLFGSRPNISAGSTMNYVPAIQLTATWSL